MNVIGFWSYECSHHIVLDIGVLFILCAFTCIYIFCKYKEYSIKDWILNHIILLFVLLFIFMILSRPLITYYSSIATWFACFSIVGVIVQLKSIKNNKIGFNIIRYHFPKYGKINNKPTFTLINTSGKDIRYLKIYAYLDRITKVEDSTSNSESDKIHHTMKVVGMWLTTSINKPFKYVLKGNDKKKNILKNHTLYNIIHEISPLNYGKYMIHIKFVCINNYKDKKIKLSYLYEPNMSQSKVTRIYK